MKDGYYDTKNWLEARISIAFADATLSSDPTSNNYQTLMLDNVATARQWMDDFSKDATPSTIIEFVTDDAQLVQEASDFISQNDKRATLRTYNLIYANGRFHYVVVRIFEANASVLFKTFFGGRDVS